MKLAAARHGAPYTMTDLATFSTARTEGRYHDILTGAKGSRKMAEKESSIICVTCDRPFPDDFNKDNAPKYFAQYYLWLTAYDWDHFGNEARNLTSYIKAVADLIRYADQDIEDETYRTIFQLMGELSEEVDRRLTHTLDAMEAEWKRNKEASEKATHARKEGV